MNSVISALTTKRGAKWTFVLSLFVFIAIIGAFAPKSSSTAPVDIPSKSQSALVREAQAQLPSAATTSAIVVYSRAGSTLTASDDAAIAQRAVALAPLAFPSGTTNLPQGYRPDAAFIVVPLKRTDDGTVLANQVAEVKKVATESLPSGITTEITGEAGFTVDLQNVFKGADVTLLLVTALVVAFLLIITYRSPSLFLVPLIVIGLATQVASALSALILPHVGLTFDAATSGILSVLVFGAGTDYSLLLISRYRDELSNFEDRHEAMRAALLETWRAVASSGATVALSLLALVLATIPSTRSLGLACAIGVVVAVVAALVLLPAALSLFGRGIFWPATPRLGQPKDHSKGYFGRLGRGVQHRPWVATVLSVVVLGLLSIGVTQMHLGLSQSQAFRNTPESVRGQITLAKAFPAGTTAPVVVIANADSSTQVIGVVTAVPGVVSARETVSNGARTEIDAVITAAPDTPESYATIRAMREALAAHPGYGAIVGGPVAESLDSSDAWARDRGVLIPVVLGIIFVVLILVLRALVAPVLLIATVIASYFAALGASQLLFTHLYHYPAVDVGVPLIAFIFLAALGVDYNIFLISRVLEERRRRSTSDAMVKSLAVTGVVITSAGILLAAVFAVLGVLPLITLTQVGVIVGLGVLLDTLLVRTVLVPALCFLTGERFWWPRRLGDVTDAA